MSEEEKQLKEHYSTLAESQLLKILQNPTDYHPLAQSVATNELNERGYDDRGIVDLLREAENEAVFQNIERKQHWQSKAQRLFVRLGILLNPRKRKTGRQLIVISLLAWSVFLLRIFYLEVRFQIEIASDLGVSALLSWELIPTLGYYLVCGAAIFLALRRFKAGWPILMWLIGLTLAKDLSEWLVLILSGGDVYYYDFQTDFIRSLGVMMSPLKSHFQYFIWSFVLGLSFFLLCQRKVVRSYFRIGDPMLLWMVLIVVLLTVAPAYQHLRYYLDLYYF